MDVEEKSKISFEETIEKYDFVGSSDYSVDAIHSQISNLNNIYIQNANLLKIQVLNRNDIEYLRNNDIFKNLQEYSKAVIMNIKNKNPKIKHVNLRFTFYFVCNEEYKDELKNVLSPSLNKYKNIREFDIKLLVETKEYLLEKY